MAFAVAHLLSGDLWAGAEVASAHLIRALHRAGDVGVRAVLLNPGTLEEELRNAGVPVQVVPEGGRSFRELAREVRRELGAADLVHAHRYKEDLLAALSGRPWLATQHGRPEPFRGRAALRMAAYQGLDVLAKRLLARRVVAVSSEVEAWLGRRVGPAKTVRLANGIEDPHARVAPDPWSRRPRRVGCVARLAPVKGLDLAIDAVAACPGVELEIVGDGPERGALARRAVASGAGDRIHLVGFERDPLPRVGRWRALLLPSLHEGNPICVLEALALGTPVLSATLPGVEEILQGQGGWCVPTRDPTAWGERVGRAVEEGAPASEAARRRFLADFTAEAAASRVGELYAAILRGEGSPRRP